MKKFQKVEKRLNNLGYYFIDKNIKNIYKDVNNKYHLIDKNGYKYFCCLKHIFKDKLPHFVGTTNPYSIENIKNWIIINKKNYILLSDSFCNSHEKLEFKCLDCNNNFKRNWNNIKSGKGCRICRYKKQKEILMKSKTGEMLSDYNDICLDWSNKNIYSYHKK